MSYHRDGGFVTRLLREYDGMNALKDERDALKELGLRILLLIQATLNAVNNAAHYSGTSRVGVLTTDAKNSSASSPTNNGTPGGAILLLFSVLRSYS